MVRRLEYWLKLSGYKLPGLSEEEEKPELTHTESLSGSNGAIPGPSKSTSHREDTEGASAASNEFSLGPVQEKFQPTQPEFPLFPCSKGFCLTLHKHLEQLRGSLLKMGLTPTPE